MAEELKVGKPFKKQLTCASVSGPVASTGDAEININANLFQKLI